MINNLTDEYAHLEDLVGRLLGAIGQGHTLTAAERERLVDEALTTKVDALVPLITAVEFLADGPKNVAFDTDLREPLLRSNEGFTDKKRSWLHVACARGDLDTVTALVERCGLDPARADPDLNAQTPLHVAAARGHIEVVASLLKRGGDKGVAKQDGDGRTPRQCAEHHGHAKVAGFIKFWEPTSSASFDPGCQEEKTTAPPLSDLPPKDEDARNDPDDAKTTKTGLPMLADEFADLESLVARLFDAIGERSQQQSRRMSTEEERERLINEARKVKHLAPLIAVVEYVATAPGAELLGDDVRKRLLRSNEGYTQRNRSWFHVACARGDLDAVTVLVERCGVDPTQCEPDCNKETPLHTAAHRGFIDVVAFLLKCGLDETLKDWFGRTPRDCAASHSDVDGLFNASAKSSSHGVARQVAKEVAEERAADDDVQVKDLILPKWTAF